MKHDDYVRLTAGKSSEDVALLDLAIHTESCLERVAAALERIADKIPELIEAITVV